MHAALVTDFARPPAYAEIADPVAREPGELVVDVVAAGLHPRVRSQAGGSHYTSTDELPLVPGIDAVVRDPSGRLRFAVLDDTTLGTMAERTVIEKDRSVLLPRGVDPVLIAAAMNPVMSSWVALRRRVRFRRGQRVLVLGATGNAGRMALEVARRFGAAEVYAAGRNQELLAEIARRHDVTAVGLDQVAAAAGVDIVLDYLWGEPSAAALVDLLTARPDRGVPLTWVQIGSVAGLTAPIPSAALRAVRLSVVGSGIGSVPGRYWVKELPRIAKAVAAGGFDVRARAVPLAAVETAWADRRGGERLVLVP